MSRGSARGRGVALGAVALAVTLSACGADLPRSVIPESVVKIGWSEGLTSTNTASTDGATTGNLDVAAMTRGRFAAHVDGDVRVDKAFGKVTVTDPAPSAFTVRYDLAEPQWSDGIPVDAADLLLAWAAGSNALTPEGFDSLPGELRSSTKVPAYDEFKRSIDVRFSQPVLGWQTALDVAVPAHVVGQRALDVEDPMEAKQKVITAIEEADATALKAIARTWNDSFDLDPKDEDVAPELLVSSGPYRIERIEQGEAGTERVRLVANGEYTGKPSPTYEHVELVRGSADGQLADLGRRLDVVQVAPTAANRQPVRLLERRDHDLFSSHNGRIWVLVLRQDRGVLRQWDARVAFLRAVPRSEMTAAGAGSWAGEYEATSSLLFLPGSRSYDLALEDAGFTQLFGSAGGNAEDQRTSAGVPAGAPVCVLYDRREPFATAAFAALRSGVAEAGWGVQDCGSKDLQAAQATGKGWHALLTSVPVPETPAEISALWGSGRLGGAASPERRRLVGELARSADVYLARDARIRIEASLISDAVALPLALQPLVTVADKDVTGVEPRGGRSASLTWAIAAWAPPAG